MRLARVVFPALSAGLLALLLVSCHDSPVAPQATAQKRTATRALKDDSPASGSAEFTISGLDPIAGQEGPIGYFPFLTIVSIDVHQSITATPLQPGSPSATMGLGGRGCSHQAEAYLVEFPDDGGFNFPFAGCLIPDPGAFTYSSIVAVIGTLRYGTGFDRSCPPPDSGCSSYSGSSGIQVTRLAASMNLTVDPDSVGPSSVPAGYPLTFRANVTPDHLGGFATPFLLDSAGWTFTNAAGAVTILDCTFGSGDNTVCPKAFYESGTLTLTAIVNGVHMNGGPIAVNVVLPQLTLSAAPDSVAAGDTVVLTATLSGGLASDIQNYTFTPTPIPNSGGVGIATSRGVSPSARRHGSLGSSAAVTKPIGGTRAARTPVTGRRSITPSGKRLSSASVLGLPSCGPGVLQCWAVPSVSGTYTVSATVRRLPIRADAAVQVTGDQHLTFENFSGGGGGVVASRSSVTPRSALRSAAEAPASLTVRMNPSERIGIKKDTVFSTKQFRAIVTDGLGRRVPNADVKLSLSAHEFDSSLPQLSGGHEHSDPRFPKDPGIFGTNEGQKGDTLTTVNTGFTTDGAVFTYRAPDPAGLVTIHGLVGTNVRATLDVDVGVDSLVELTETHLFKKVGNAHHHPERFWVTMVERTMLIKLADSLITRFASAPMPDTIVRRLSVNDASLPKGGLFDIWGGVDTVGRVRVDWQPPHFDHRRGQGVDIRIIDKTDEQIDFIKAYWTDLGGHVYDESNPNAHATGPHYHLERCPTCKR